MEKLSDSLTEQRKQQKAPSSYPKKEDLTKFKETSSFPVHQSTAPGINDIDILDENMVLTAGNDGQAILMNATGESLVNKLTPYEGSQVTISRFVPGQKVDDNTESILTVLGGSGKGQCGVWDIMSGKQ